MPNPQQPVQALTTNSPICQPSPTVIKNWPIGGTAIQCSPVTPDTHSGHKGSAILLDIKFTLALGVELNEDATLSLLYIVNGSLDYSGLFSQTEISRHNTVTFKKGQSEASVTILTLPVLPNATFELEVLAYPASVGTIISGPVRAQADERPSPSTPEADAEDKSLKALNVLATTALVTALGALAFALLRSRD